MAKFNPDFYGDKPHGAPVQQTVNVGISISPERLSEIRTKLDSTRTALAPRICHASTSENGLPTRTKSSVSPKQHVSPIQDVKNVRDVQDQDSTDMQSVVPPS
jgi:hypothetical protein